jgi:uncharacterized membrane protein (DUF485 family)
MILGIMLLLIPILFYFWLALWIGYPKEWLGLMCMNLIVASCFYSGLKLIFG